MFAEFMSLLKVGNKTSFSLHDVLALCFVSTGLTHIPGGQRLSFSMLENLLHLKIGPESGEKRSPEREG